MYQAVIQDAGKGKNYDLNVRLAIIQRNASTGNEYVVQSSAFRVFSEADPPGTVRTGLPVVYVDTQGGRPVNSKEEYVKASLKIKGRSSSRASTPRLAKSAAAAIRPGTGPRNRI